MAARIDAVLTVIYLVFNEGYTATRGGPLLRVPLCAEAIRLGRLVRTLMGQRSPAEAAGLLALMLLHDARRNARMDDAGDIIPLDEQDRRLWNQRQIAEALPLVQEGLHDGPGPFALQAAIAAAHCQAARAADTNWNRIVRLYDLLNQVQPSPVVLLNRAVAVSMSEGPQPALELVDALVSSNDLENYHPLHAVRADLLRRLGSWAEAANSYRKAIALVSNDSERRFLERRLREVQQPAV
jgi:RNA polymerase sigma-70 factor (ECF subfamily)